MKTTDKLVEHFGNKEATIKCLGINRETWRLWVRDGVPLGKALFVEQMTAGKVAAEDVIADARQTA
ncbi:MAG TPA: Cro/CI family transcriptional regulator [Burkholderiales bacterium]|nr:Cro/CI family transcriptional regulator [Burkholderiales bacterium]